MEDNSDQQPQQVTPDAPVTQNAAPVATLESPQDSLLQDNNNQKNEEDSPITTETLPLQSSVTSEKSSENDVPLYIREIKNIVEARRKEIEAIDEAIKHPGFFKAVELIKQAEEAEKRKKWNDNNGLGETNSTIATEADAAITSTLQTETSKSEPEVTLTETTSTNSESNQASPETDTVLTSELNPSAADQPALQTNEDTASVQPTDRIEQPLDQQSPTPVPTIGMTSDTQQIPLTNPQSPEQGTQAPQTPTDNQ